MITEFLHSWELFHNTYLAGWCIGLFLSLVGILAGPDLPHRSQHQGGDLWRGIGSVVERLGCRLARATLG